MYDHAAAFRVTSCAGDDDEDELVPLKLKETKRFKDRKVVGMEIGGQMAFLLAVTKGTAAAQPAAAATAQGATKDAGKKTAVNGAASTAANGASKAAGKTQSAAQSHSAQTGSAESEDGAPEPVPMDSE